MRGPPFSLNYRHDSRNATRPEALMARHLRGGGGSDAHPEDYGGDYELYHEMEKHRPKKNGQETLSMQPLHGGGGSGAQPEDYGGDHELCREMEIHRPRKDD